MCKKEEKQRPSFNHLYEYPWLIVSDVKKGLICKYFTTSKVKELRATLGYRKRDDTQNASKQIFEKAIKVMEK